MKKKTASWLLLLILFSVLAVPAGATDAITLRWSHFVAKRPAKAMGTGDHFFIDQVQKRTGGRIQFQVHWGGSLGKENENFGLVSQGTVDVASFYTAAFESQFPLYAAPNSMFFVMHTLEEAYQAAVQIPEKIRGVQDELAARNVKLLYHLLLPEYVLFSRKPVVKFEDLKGLKLRTVGVYLPQAYQAAGAVGVNLLLPEIFESLQRGVVDGTTWAPNTAALMGLHKVAPHVNRWGIGTIVGYGIFINLDTWKKLSPDLQEIIDAVAAETQKRIYENAIRSEAFAWKKIREEGGQVHDVPQEERDKWLTACPDFLDNWATRMDKLGKGEAAREMRDLWQKIIETY